MTALRINGFQELDNSKMSYWRTDDGSWLLYIPGCGLGNLKKHHVIEHEDRTITVSPSILCRGHENGNAVTVHGYLERGIWRAC